MSTALFGLSSTLWVSEVGAYLLASDILTLRMASKETLAFFAMLFPDFAAQDESRMAQMRQLIPPDVQAAESRIYAQEPRRQHIISITIEPRHFAEISSYARPPQAVLQSLEVIVGLKVGKPGPSWDFIKSELKKPTFLSEVKDLLSRRSAQPVPQQIRNVAATLSVQAVMNVSRACADLLSIAQNYIGMQDEFNREGVKQWFTFEEKLAAIEKEKEVFLRVEQGMPVELRKPKGYEEAKTSGKKPGGQKDGASHKKAGAKKSGKSK